MPLLSQLRPSQYLIARSDEFDLLGDKPSCDCPYVQLLTP